jgi:hypothetical protein
MITIQHAMWMGPYPSKAASAEQYIQYMYHFKPAGTAGFVSPTVFLKSETCDHYIKNHYILVAKDPKKEMWVFAPTFIDFQDARWALLVFVLAYMDVR